MTHVLKTSLLIAAVGLLSIGRIAGAADVSTLLPFVDEQTAVVLRIEPATLSSEFRQRLAMASGFLPATVRGQLRRVLENAEITESFAVASLADRLDEMPFVVFKRPSEWTEADSMALVDQTQFKASSIGDAVIVALPTVLERLKQISPNSKQDAVQEAFTETSQPSRSRPLQLAVILNDDQRRVVAELWQSLLDRNAPMDAGVIANTKWAVLSVTDVDQLSVELIAQTTGKPSPTEWWSSINQSLPNVHKFKPIKRSNSPPDRIAAETSLSGGWVTGTLDKWTKATNLQTARRNLGKIGLAMHNYYSAYKRLPAAATKDPSGQPLLSWRVQILAFLGPQEQKLFRKFHMDEPWDSPHNRRLIQEMPDAFRVDLTTPSEGRSTIAIPLGESMIFHNDAPSFNDIIDGLSNTIMVVEVPEDRGEIWTKPGSGVVIDPQNPARGIGGHFGDKALVLWGDGSVRLLDVTKYRDTLHSMFTRNGKENFKHPSADP